MGVSRRMVSTFALLIAAAAAAAPFFSPVAQAQSLSRQWDDADWLALVASPAIVAPAPAPSVPGPPRGTPAVYLPPADPPADLADEGDAEADLPDDPLEQANRYAHAFNGFLRTNLLEPVALTYLDVASPAVQRGVANVFANLREPFTILSDLMLGEVTEAGNATARLAINTTAGLGGYFDRAAEWGYPRRPKSFEEVLCHYGVPEGPYLVLPILGPATARDAVGRVTTLGISWLALGPVYVPYRASDIAVQYVERREQLRFIDSISVDPYAAQRSAYQQAGRLTCEQKTEAQSQRFIH